jgi:hypothetical protein
VLLHQIHVVKVKLFLCLSNIKNFVFVFLKILVDRIVSIGQVII